MTNQQWSVCVGVLSFLLAACGPGVEPGGTGGGSGGGSGGGGGSAAATCTPTATFQTGMVNGRKVMQAVGTVSCTGATALNLSLCLQQKSSSGFTDLQCQTSNQSSAQAFDDTVSLACFGVKTFRARLTGTAAGTAVDVTSAESTVDCM